MKISVNKSLHIEGFSGAAVTDYSAGNTNTIVFEKEGSAYTTQRPAIDISEDTSALGLDNKARGIFYWEQNTSLYIVNDDTLYKTDQSTPVASGPHFSSGTEPVKILETIGATPYMVVIDAANNEAWSVSTGDAVAQITTNFPTTLAHGGTELDGYILVMDEDGVIYNSDALDITFSATSFVTAERENDRGVYLGKHHEHVAAFLSRSIEFFYNANNTSGSILNRRRDISYNIGAVSGISVWENGDNTYFIGANNSGQMAVYELKSFQLNKISDEAIDSYVTENLAKSDIYFRLSGLRFMGHDTLIITVFTLSASGINPLVSFSFDTTTRRWEFIKTSLTGYATFPLMSFTRRTGGHNETVSARAGEGIFHDGGVFDISDRLTPVDTVLEGLGVYSSGVYASGVYIGGTSGQSANIPTIMRTGLYDAGINGYKTEASINIEMESTDSPQTMTIKKSNEKTDDFDTGKTIDTSKARKERRSGGRFIRRNRQLEYIGDEQFYIKGIDVELEGGL